MLDQREIARNLKIERMDSDDFKYSDIAAMLDMQTTSLYNFLSGQYTLSQSKAKILRDWLNDRN